MCGFAGFLDPSSTSKREDLRQRALQMAACLIHRGPDSSGEWVDERAGIALGYRRLAIIDVSPAGNQPMVSACARYVITLNGEIYNFEDLRHELVQAGWGFPWRGRSDTEVILAAISRWGLERALEKTNGMFALALWDRQTRELHLVRDRLGEKPLYYGWSRGVFLFGSELKALRSHPAWQGEIDRDALALYLRYNCVPTPHCIYRGVRKLPPATRMRVRPDGEGRYFDEAPEEYWSARSAVEHGAATPFRGSRIDAEDALEELLTDAVRRRMYADVPLGAFLSGGIDSSTVVALMQVQSSKPIKTFTIGFREAAYDEAQSAKAVAAHLGTEHTEHHVTPVEARDVIPLLPELYDEPFADSSQIPTYLLSRLTRQHVTVSLSGDGGDELFGGYIRHSWVPSVWQWMRRVPLPVRKAAAAAIGGISPAGWDEGFRIVGPVLPGWAKQRTPGYKLHKLAEVLTQRDPAAMYSVLTSHWKQPVAVVLGAREPLTLARHPQEWPLGPERISEQMMYVDLVTYLPDDILVKIDRASMGVSLEARVPFLDHRLVEFAWSLPLRFKIRERQGKHILRSVLDRHVPRSLTDRPKIGFGLPIDSWLRGPLRPWAEDMLDETRLRREGFFDPRTIRAKLHEHMSGKRNWQYHLWDILMFQSWSECAGSG